MLFGLSTIFLHKSHSPVLNISRDFCFKTGKFQPLLLIKVLLIKKKACSDDYSGVLSQEDDRCDNMDRCIQMRSWFLEAINPADQWFQRRQPRRIRAPRARRILKIDYDPRTRYVNGTTTFRRKFRRESGPSSYVSIMGPTTKNEQWWA